MCCCFTNNVRIQRFLYQQACRASDQLANDWRSVSGACNCPRDVYILGASREREYWNTASTRRHYVRMHAAVYII